MPTPRVPYSVQCNRNSREVSHLVYHAWSPWPAAAAAAVLVAAGSLGVPTLAYGATDAVTIDSIASLGTCDQAKLRFSGTATYADATQHLFVDVSGRQVLHRIGEPAVWRTRSVAVVGAGSYTVTASVYDQLGREGLLAQATRAFTIPACDGAANGEPEGDEAGSSGDESQQGNESTQSEDEDASSDENDDEDDENTSAEGEEEASAGDERAEAAGAAKQARVQGAAAASALPARLKPLNAMFRVLYGRNPTFSEWSYWANRLLTDKTGHDALYGAMQWHKLRGRTTEKEFEDFDPKNFARSTTIDNAWWPLQPGTQFVYEGFTDAGGERVPHRIVFTVTDLTKVIAGVRTVVILDRDYSAGQLVESELALFAQDNDGNVWHLGQYPEEYEGGKFVAAPAWIHGVEEARAGVSIKAAPRLGMPSYSQGWGPAVNWADRARVYQTGQQTRVPAGRYQDVLVTEEFSWEEPNSFQLKYYARGVGNVRVGWRGDDAQQEELELVKRVPLDAKALAQIRAEALALEKRAYEISQDVYAHTPPAEHLPGVESL